MYYLMFFMLTFFALYGAVSFFKFVYISLLARISFKKTGVKIYGETPKFRPY
ncbi:MAG: hypothetical protein FWH20_03865 [Oscillospiraceae bacterium]|nr:hypothetical protein [Oscillospiraceae bacterium]